MKEWNYKFISSKPLLTVCLIGIIFPATLLVGTTVCFTYVAIQESLSTGAAIFLILTPIIVYLLFIALAVVLLWKELYSVEMFEDKFVFKALWQKEHILYFKDIKNIYEYHAHGPYANIVINYYIFEKDAEEINQSSISEDSLAGKKIFKFGYPFKIAINEQNKKKIMEFWTKPFIKIT